MDDTEETRVLKNFLVNHLLKPKFELRGTELRYFPKIIEMFPEKRRLQVAFALFPKDDNLGVFKSTV